MFAHLQGLGRVFEDHRVARHERRSDRVDRGHVGIVPRGHDQDDAHRLALDHPFERAAVFDEIGLERVFGDRGHVEGALVEATEFAAIADRAAHLVGQLVGHAVDRLADIVVCLEHEIDALLHRTRGPILLCGAGAGGGGKGRLFAQRLAFEIDRSVDRRNTADNLAHVRPFQNRGRSPNR